MCQRADNSLPINFQLRHFILRTIFVIIIHVKCVTLWLITCRYYILRQCSSSIKPDTVCCPRDSSIWWEKYETMYEEEWNVPTWHFEVNLIYPRIILNIMLTHLKFGKHLDMFAISRSRLSNCINSHVRHVTRDEYWINIMRNMRVGMKVQSKFMYTYYWLYEHVRMHLIFNQMFDVFRF